MLGIARPRKGCTRRLKRGSHSQVGIPTPSADNAHGHPLRGRHGGHRHGLRAQRPRLRAGHRSALGVHPGGGPADPPCGALHPPAGQGCGSPAHADRHRRRHLGAHPCGQRGSWSRYGLHRRGQVWSPWSPARLRRGANHTCEQQTCLHGLHASRAVLCGPVSRRPLIQLRNTPAQIGAVLYGDFMQYNPKDPQWLNRDRFVLSGGHGSMFLYSWLHMAGYELPMSEVLALFGLVNLHALGPSLRARRGPVRAFRKLVTRGRGEEHSSAPRARRARFQLVRRTNWALLPY